MRQRQGVINVPSVFSGYKPKDCKYVRPKLWNAEMKHTINWRITRRSIFVERGAEWPAADVNQMIGKIWREGEGCRSEEMKAWMKDELTRGFQLICLFKFVFSSDRFSLFAMLILCISYVGSEQYYASFSLCKKRWDESLGGFRCLSRGCASQLHVPILISRSAPRPVSASRNEWSLPRSELKTASVTSYYAFPCLASRVIRTSDTTYICPEASDLRCHRI